MEAFNSQRPRIRLLWGLTTQVGGARLITGWCTKFTSPGDYESPVTGLEADQETGTFENSHSKNPYHGQDAFASSWRAGSEQDQAGLFSFGFVLWGYLKMGAISSIDRAALLLGMSSIRTPAEPWPVAPHAQTLPVLLP